ncbi:unnamed protein product [Cuscuta campestris]|uniref:Protein-S-isoprenylcysteine O-methyltransferase n=1 Tax=Cuscuta campestris TaxID=132261 RepID=A0A484MZA1_9ASTE|nr:unnamed protein product [Cuscuta campestris]
MVLSSSIVGPKVFPLAVSFPNSNAFSFRHFHIHAEGNIPAKILPTNLSFGLGKTRLCSSLSLKTPSERFSSFPLNCTGSHSVAKTGSENPFLNSLKNVSVESIKSRLSQLTPLDLCKWSLVFSLAIAASRWTVGALVNPFFWMYLSWSWVFWPWMVAIGIAMYGFYCLRKHLRGEAKEFEQLAIVTAAFTWLTLVPPAHFNGFLEGWPVVFFFVYHYFFFLNVSVRKRLYGDLFPREHDPKWDISLPNWQKLLFCGGVLLGHWLAAFEGPELHLIPSGWWINAGTWALITATIFMQYHSTLYLANYSEKVVVPTAVVQFGPYRIVRHPIYASTMFLFALFCITLRAPLSTLFVIAVCLMYYGQKAKLEEALMIGTFGERYLEYAGKVKYRLIPFVY